MPPNDPYLLTQTALQVQAALNKVLTPASLPEVRAGSADAFATLARLTEADEILPEVSVSGAVLIDPRTGRNKSYVITGNTRFAPAPGITASAGVIRIRLDGDFTVTWAREIDRDYLDASLAPDPRPWVDSVYSYFVANGRMTVMPLALVPSLDAPLPVLTDFGGLFDPAGPGILVGDTGSAAATVGSAVGTYPPVGGNWNYLSSAGVNTLLNTANRPYKLASASANPPTLVEMDGRLGIRGNKAGPNLKAPHYGVAMLGNPNPSTSPNAMPYRSEITWGCAVWTPDTDMVGCLAGFSRAGNSNTSMVSIELNDDGKPYINARMATGATTQISSTERFNDDLVVHDLQIEDASLKNWRVLTGKITISSIDTIEDVAPGGAGQRGQGAQADLWLDAGYGGHETTKFSSYRGTNNFGFAPDQTWLLSRFSSTGALIPSNAVIGRSFFMMGALPVNGALYRSILRWLGGR